MNTKICRLALVFLLSSCAYSAFSLDYSCPSQSEVDVSEEDVIRVDSSNADGEYYFQVSVKSSYQGRSYSGLFLRDVNSGLMVPLKAEKQSEVINSWFIYLKTPSDKIELLAHYGTPCPVRVVKRCYNVIR